MYNGQHWLERRSLYTEVFWILVNYIHNHVCRYEFMYGLFITSIDGKEAPEGYAWVVKVETGNGWETVNYPVNVYRPPYGAHIQFSLEKCKDKAWFHQISITYYLYYCVVNILTDWRSVTSFRFLVNLKCIIFTLLLIILPFHNVSWFE